MPNDLLAVEGAARTFTCAVVVPSTGDMFDASTALDTGVGKIGVRVTCAISADGKVGVTKMGVAVNAFLLIMFPPQPVQRIIAEIKRKIFL
jgi:hypothetical protein